MRNSNLSNGRISQLAKTSGFAPEELVAMQANQITPEESTAGFLRGNMSSQKLITVGSYNTSKVGGYNIIVNDESVITMEHASEKRLPPIQPQYTQKNYLETNSMQSSYHQDKMRPLMRSTSISIDVPHERYHTLDSSWRHSPRKLKQC